MNFSLRTEKIQRFVREDINCAYLVTGKENVYYLSGFYGSFGFLLITPGKSRLFVDGRYFEQAKKTACCDEPVLVENIYTAIKETVLKEGVRKLVFDAEDVSFAFYDNLRKEAEFLTVLPAAGSVIKKMRALKDEDELNIMKEAVRKSKDVFARFMAENPLQGSTERGLAAKLEYMLKQEADGISFEPIVASGGNSSLPHAAPDDKIINSGESVILDFGLSWRHYATDHTRTFFVNGSGLEKYYPIIEGAVRKGIENIKPGSLIKSADEAVRSHFEEHGALKNVMHSSGHGIGLSVHEFPNISYKTEGCFEAGMVATIEPGLYFEGVGGIRLEEMVLVTKTGCEVL